MTATPRIRGKTLTDMIRPALSGHAVDEAEERVLASVDALREIYEQQAARGIPEAIEGLALMDQGRWPSSGRPMPQRRVPGEPLDG